MPVIVFTKNAFVCNDNFELQTSFYIRK